MDFCLLAPLWDLRGRVGGPGRGVARSTGVGRAGGSAGRRGDGLWAFPLLCALSFAAGSGLCPAMAGGPWREDWWKRERAARQQAEECARLALRTPGVLVEDPSADEPGAMVSMQAKAREVEARFLEAAEAAAWMVPRARPERSKET